MKNFLLTIILVLASFLGYTEELLVSDIKIEGLQRVEPGLVFSNLPFEVNDPIDSVDVSSTIKLLYKTGQFKDISLEQEGGKIIIIVNEKPVISDINFYGIEAFQDEKLKIGLSQMNFAEGLVFDKTDLKKVEQEIANQYLSLGKYTASVKAEAIPLERNRMQVNLYVEEGSVSRIKAINIVGNKLYEKEVLMEIFKLKTTNFLSWYNKDDRYSKQVLSGDLETLKSFGTVIIKHANPCGVSTNKNPLISFKNAFASDPISAFGGVIACNFKITKKLALEINKNFLEVILAKSFDKEALILLKKKKNLRIIDITKFKLKNITSLKAFDGSFLIQSKDQIIFDKKKLKFVTKLKPSKKELTDIEFAFNICKFVKSNAIILCNNFSTIGVGAGQPSRLDSCKIATQKAKQFQSSKIKNSVAASDAFFPFADGITTLIKAGVKTIVQPGGSIRDQEVINAADKAKIKMIFTGIRHFNH